MALFLINHYGYWLGICLANHLLHIFISTSHYFHSLSYGIVFDIFNLHVQACTILSILSIEKKMNILIVIGLWLKFLLCIFFHKYSLKLLLKIVFLLGLQNKQKSVNFYSIDKKKIGVTNTKSITNARVKLLNFLLWRWAFFISLENHLSLASV